MTSHGYQHLILVTLMVCSSLVARAAEPAKERAGLDRWTYIHADDRRTPAAGGKAGDFGVGFGDVNGDGASREHCRERIDH